LELNKNDQKIAIKNQLSKKNCGQQQIIGASVNI
jgi:hypothetical protein